MLLHSSAGRYGADRQLLLLASGLDGDRYRPLVVLAEDGPLAADLRAAGVTVRVRDLAVARRETFNPAGVAELARRALADRSALSALAREDDVALVHANTSVVLGSPRDLPRVVHVREIYGSAAGPAWAAHRRRLEHSAALVCVSGAVAAQFRGDNVHVVHDGIADLGAPLDRAEARRRLELDPGAFVVAVAARLTDWKGQDVLLRALAEPGQEATTALLAGDAWPGREERAERLRDLAARLGLGPRAHFTGYADPRAVYAAADLVAVPSTAPDPLPNSALEAAAAGACVVASAIGGLPEIVSDGETGRLFPAGDHAALAALITELAGDEPQRRRLADRARADVAHRFSARVMVRQVQNIWDAVLDA